MSYKILEQNGIDNENIDGGAFNNFAAGNRDGVLKGVLEECFLVAEGNSISIGTGVIILQGIRVKITDPEIISVSSVPSKPVRYQIVVQLVMEEGNLSCSFFVRIPTELIKDNFYNSGKGNGIYQQELGRVTHGTNGNLTDIQRTLDIISGGGGTSTHSVEIGNVSTNMIDAGLPAEVDVDSRVEGEKVVIDFNFSFPESRANTIYTVKNLTVKETNNRQFLSDVFLPEGEIENSDTVCLQGLDISSLSPELQNYVNSIEDSGIIYLNRVSPKAFFAVLGAVARPDLYEVNNSGAFSLYLVGNEYGQYQLFGTVISDQSGSAVSAVFDNAGNPLVYKYVKPDTGIPKSDLESSVQTSLSKADSALQSIPIATPSVVGGVKPVTKTSEMTQEVGVDSNGALWTKEASEGTTVVANPTATGTQDLTSLQVGGTVYNIPQQGGIVFVSSLPTPTQIEYEKHLLYLQGTSLNYLVAELATEPTVETVAALPNPKAGGSSATVGTDCYIFCGRTDSRYSSVTNQIVKFDTISQTVTTLNATLGRSLARISSAAVDTNCYTFGGQGANSYNVFKSIYLSLIHI